jgi:hypothetical protein
MGSELAVWMVRLRVDVQTCRGKSLESATEKTTVGGYGQRRISDVISDQIRKRIRVFESSFG